MHHICHKSTTLVFLSHLFSISLSLVKASVTSTVWTVLTTRKLEARETDRDKIENRDEREKGEKQMDGWFRTVCLPSLSPSLSSILELFCLLREKTDRQKTPREKRWWWQDDDEEREELEGIMSVLKRRREKMVLLWRYVLVFLPEEGIKGETWLPIQKFSLPVECLSCSQRRWEHQRENCYSLRQMFMNDEKSQSVFDVCGDGDRKWKEFESLEQFKNSPTHTRHSISSLECAVWLDANSTTESVSRVRTFTLHHTLLVRNGSFPWTDSWKDSRRRRRQFA